MRSSYTALVASGVLAVATLGLTAPVQADPGFTPAANDLSGVGSDTSELVMNALANGYNAQSPAPANKLASFNALNPNGGPAGDQILLHTGTATIARPNGSGAGKILLYGTSNNPNVNFARSSSALSSDESNAGLQAYPFALDTLRMATSATTNAPSGGLTGDQVLKIYQGTITNWSQVGGKSGTIVPFVPQSGSGTLSFFTAQLKALNNGTPVTLSPSVQTTQEHSPTDIQNNPNAVAPFSEGRGKNISTIHLANGWYADRALYNVVRGADAGTYTGIFGTSGYLCSTAARSIIEANGFYQLKSVGDPTDPGNCGVVSTTTPTGNLKAYNRTFPPAYQPTTQPTPPAPAGPAASSLGVNVPRLVSHKTRSGGSVSVSPAGNGGNVTITETTVKKVHHKKRTITRTLTVAPVSNGVAGFSLPKLKKGVHRLTATFSGNSAAQPSAQGFTVRSK